MFQLGFLVVRAAVLGSAAVTFVRYCRIDLLQIYGVFIVCQIRKGRDSGKQWRR